MKRCLNSYKSRFNLYFCTIGFAALSLFFVFVFVYIIYSVFQEWTPGFLYHNLLNIVFGIVWGFFTALTSVIWIRFGFRFYKTYSRKYYMDEKGITIRYFTNEEFQYTWAQVADVCVCDIDHRRNHQFDIVIRLGLYSETNGPLTCTTKNLKGYEIWRSGLYLQMHPQDVIYLDYSATMCEQIETLSAKQIRDRRTQIGKNFKIDLWDSYPHQ